MTPAHDAPAPYGEPTAPPGAPTPHRASTQPTALGSVEQAEKRGVDAAPAFSTVPDAPRSEDPVLVAGLREDLVAAGFTVDRVTELVGEQAMSAWSRDEAVPARRALERHGSRDPLLTTLAAFFLLGDPVSAPELDAALPTVGATGLRSLALAEDGPAAGELLATMDLRPYATDASDEWFVASDLGAFQRPGVLRHDHVLGIGGASTTLVQATPRRDVERALDLGTGCGIQTFHLLSHARHVTATDISERALATTRFNLVLNAAQLGLDPDDLSARVRLAHGSMLEPVAGDRFDMVVSNPPFVITPRTPGDDAARYTYRDGGLPGDRLVSDLIASLPEVLTPGGTAHMLANWEITADPEQGPSETWSRRPASWIAPGTGAWFVQRELQDPCEYAETWLRDASQQRDLAGYEAAYRAYLEDFDSRDVAAVGFGMVWLQRPGAVEPDSTTTPRPGTQAPDAPVLPRATENRPLPRVFETIPHPIQQPIAPALAAEWDRMVCFGTDHAAADAAVEPASSAAADAQGAAGTTDGSLTAAETGARDVVPGTGPSAWTGTGAVVPATPAWLDAHLTVAPDVTEERHGAPGADDPALILLRQGAGLRRTVILSSEAAGFAGVCDGELSAGQILTALGSLLGWQDGPEPWLTSEINGLVEHGFLVEV